VVSDSDDESSDEDAPDDMDIVRSEGVMQHVGRNVRKMLLFDDDVDAVDEAGTSATLDASGGSRSPLSPLSERSSSEELFPVRQRWVKKRTAHTLLQNEPLAKKQRRDRAFESTLEEDAVIDYFERDVWQAAFNALIPADPILRIAVDYLARTCKRLYRLYISAPNTPYFNQRLKRSDSENEDALGQVFLELDAPEFTRFIYMEYERESLWLADFIMDTPSMARLLGKMVAFEDPGKDDALARRLVEVRKRVRLMLQDAAVAGGNRPWSNPLEKKLQTRASLWNIDVESHAKTLSVRAHFYSGLLEAGRLDLVNAWSAVGSALEAEISHLSDFLPLVSALKKVISNGHVDIALQWNILAPNRFQNVILLDNDNRHRSARELLMYTVTVADFEKVEKHFRTTLPIPPTDQNFILNHLPMAVSYHGDFDSTLRKLEYVRDLGLMSYAVPPYHFLRLFRFASRDVLTLLLRDSSGFVYHKQLGRVLAEMSDPANTHFTSMPLVELDARFSLFLTEEVWMILASQTQIHALADELDLLAAYLVRRNAVDLTVRVLAIMDRDGFRVAKTRVLIIPTSDFRQASPDIQNALSARPWFITYDEARPFCAELRDIFARHRQTRNFNVCFINALRRRHAARIAFNLDVPRADFEAFLLELVQHQSLEVPEGLCRWWKERKAAPLTMSWGTAFALPEALAMSIEEYHFILLQDMCREIFGVDLTVSE
jgi:hypothetical protein